MMHLLLAGGPMTCKHVMVVDDDQDIREGLAEVLAYEGYDVYSAENGQVALDQLNHLSTEELPGCILLDINMPVMDGVTFLHELEHTYQRLAGIPVCVASANTEVHNKDLAHATMKLRKPLSLDQIYNVVHEFCGNPH